MTVEEVQLCLDELEESTDLQKQVGEVLGNHLMLVYVYASHGWH